jgi:hypothetical protein
MPGSGQPTIRFSHQWPGVYFEAAFVGTSVDVRFDDAENSYQLLVDDSAPRAIVRPGKSVVRITGLRPSTHRVRLEKVNESTSANGAFLGFFIDRGSRPLRVRPRPRQIEFIGDSSVTGFGVRSAKQTCTSDEVWLTTNTQSAYGALVGKHYNADYQINAVSARGVVRNYAGILPDLTLPRVYPYTFPNKTVPYDGASWKPQIVFIKLNADFVGDLHAGERWQNFAEVAFEYANGLGAFVAEIHKRSPSAAFVIWWFDPKELGDVHTRDVFGLAQRDIVAAAQKAGPVRVEFLPMSNQGLERTACGHYTLRDQQELARRIVQKIDADFPFRAMRLR